jgi:hypothetical protein
MSYEVYPITPVPANWGGKKVSWGTRTSQGWESGKSLSSSYWQEPLREIPLDYQIVGNDVAAGEFDNLYGFFMTHRGSARCFLFSPFYVGTPNAPHMVQGAQLGVGDGQTVAFQARRLIGSYQEAIAYLDPYPPYYGFGAGGYGLNGYGGPGAQTSGREPPYVYLDGALQYTGYHYDEAGQIIFDVPPPAGAPVSADFNFFYLMRFKSDEFSVVLKGYGPTAGLWELQRVTLVQERA